MLLCYVCKAHHKSSALLCQHLRLYHGLYPGKTLRLKCGQPGCCLSFCTYSGFKKHLVNFHRDGANTADNVDTQNEAGEPSTSQAASTDSPITTKLSVDNGHVLLIAWREVRF